MSNKVSKPQVKEDESKSVVIAEPESANALVAVDLGEDVGAGLENIERDEYRIPFIRILQANSPQTAPVENGGLQGAKAGDFFNTSTGELYDGKAGFDFIPAHRDHNYTEWLPRDANGNGGGFVGLRPSDDDLVIQLKSEQGKFGKLRVDGGKTELVETFYLFGLAHLNGVWVPVAIGFSSTQIGKYQTFMGRVPNMKYLGPDGKAITPPIWFHMWHFNTVYESNKKGKFYGYKLTLAAKNEDGTEAHYTKSAVPRSNPLYQQAKEFHDGMIAGDIKADVAHSDTNDAPIADEDSPL